MPDDIRIKRYEGPAGGWGSVRSLFRHALKSDQNPEILTLLRLQNKPDGFACVSCAWAKPADPHPAEFCENGAKATFHENMGRRATPDFFRDHTVSELRGWTDYELEQVGRLTVPLRYDAASDRYLTVRWEEAFAEIGAELAQIRAEDPRKTVFYASGRASLETSYMYQLLARLYGNNNLPDSSNMCHESTSVALPESIGVSVGTVRLPDFEQTDAIFFFGQNVGSNSPRMLHPLQDAAKRGVPIVVFNPLRERGLERFTNPQNPVEMLTGSETRLSDQYHQVKAGGDIAAIVGMAKALLAWDVEAKAKGDPSVLDHDFIAQHTHGFAEFAAYVRAQEWSALERHSGLSRDAMERAAAVYARANSVIAVYGMGLTQHKLGVDSVQVLVNFLLMRGNIGRPGAGICPVRGHSNVQGQRTVGITEKPSLAPLDRLATLYQFSPPREEGLTTIDTCTGILEGTVEAFIGLGGNFLRAVPETKAMERAWPRMRLTVQVATTLNRGQLFAGKVAYILPCLGRTEIDMQATGRQVVTVEDSTSCFHASRGFATPASPFLLSEPRIVAEIAKATLPANPRVPWDEWVTDYARVRDAIERTWPETFADFNNRMWTKGGMEKPLPARDRQWKTTSGRANFKIPGALSAAFPVSDEGPDVLRLITLRSNDQFNTTIYGYRDRFRGIEGTRLVLLMNPGDMRRLGLSADEVVGLRTAVQDGVERVVKGLRIVPYNVPPGCCGGYYPELNALIPVWQHADRSKVPAAKSVPVRVERLVSAMAAE